MKVQILLPLPRIDMQLTGADTRFGSVFVVFGAFGASWHWAEWTSIGMAPAAVCGEMDDAAMAKGRSSVMGDA